MWAMSIVVLLICQHLSPACSTRLPLEVYELTPPAAPPATANAAASSATSTSSAPATASHSAAENSTNNLQHKNLEYATVNAKTLTAAVTATATNHSEAPADLHYLDTSDTQALERRRSRQMLEIIERQHQHQHPHRFNHDAMQQQKQQQQQMLHEKDANGRRHGHAPDVRILYQVGDSEDDLPVCAPNAVCSKIDLYETPWIERQCRCPDLNRQPHVVIHHHQHHTNNKESLNDATRTATHSDKFRSYYEKEKLLQHKRLLVSEFSDKKFESLHLKKLMQKLGAVYEDDLHLSPSDFAQREDNDALPSELEEAELDPLSGNEFPHAPRRSYYATAAGSASGAHMRHSGHGSHRAKEAREATAFIGGCPSALGIEDGHTIADKTRHYKLCQPVHKLPVCKHFRDYTWTLTTSADLNVTEQIVHCRCPKNSVTYLTKREPIADGSSGYTYLFACSPLTRIRCQRKQPCKLFTVRKRQEFLDEVNINALCQCPKGHRCPSHHTQSGVIAGESFLEDNIQTYSGYCMTND